jgi:hypothetical protein
MPLRETTNAARVMRLGGALVLLTGALGLLGCPTKAEVRQSAQDSQVEQPAQEEEQLLDTEEEMEPESQPDDGSFE